MAQRHQAREVKLIDVINIGSNRQKFEIVVGTASVRRYDVGPGEIVQIEEGYTESLERAKGRRKSTPILQQLAPNMRRVDEVEATKLAALTGKARKAAAVE